jgi:putative tryptophan/tyrosine transport system substrate-binding protein
MRRREFIMLVGGAAAARPARAQQTGRARRIAVLMSWDESNPQVQTWIAAFRDGLGKLGWVEGQNLHFEFRWTGTDSTLMEKAAKEFAAMQPDLIGHRRAPFRLGLSTSLIRSAKALSRVC